MRKSKLKPEDLNRPDWNSLKANYAAHDVGEAYLKGRVEEMGLHVEHWGIDMRDHDDHLIFDNKMDLRLWEPVDGQEQPPDKWPSDAVGHEGAEQSAAFSAASQGEAAEDGVFARYSVAHSDDPGVMEAARSHPILTEDEIRREFDVLEWECRALIDVKTKSNRDWLGVTNIRHLAHYAEWAERYQELGVPAAIYFTMVDMDSETVGRDNIFIPITTDWGWEELIGHYDGSESVSWPRRREIADEFVGTKETFVAPDGNDVVRFREDYFENFNWFVDEVL